MEDVLTAVPSIRINGRTLAPDHESRLVHVRVELAVGTVGAAQVRYNQADILDNDQFFVGDELLVTVLDDTGTVTILFTGLITGLGIARDHRGTELVVDALDESVRLGSVSVNTSHLNTSIGGVIGQLAQEAGLRADVDSSLTSIEVDFLQQTGTPHQFLDQMAYQYGCEWVVRDQVLRVAPRSTSHATVIAVADPRAFQARYSAVEEASEVTVRGWDPGTKEAIIGKAPSSKGDLRSNKVPVAVDNRGKFEPKEAVSYLNTPDSQTAADALAQASLRRLESNVLTGRGEVDVNPEIKPLTVVDISGVAPDWDGEYYITGVQHVWGHPGQSFVSRFTIGSIEPRTLADLLGRRPTSSTEVVSGSVTIGLVDSVQDEDAQGRVRVILPYIATETTSTWARVVQQGAGPGRGWVLLPEVGDEVVVAFENGDLNKPLVVGGLWNGTDKIPVAKMGDNGQVMSRSFTSRLGHQLTFFDGEEAADRYVSVVLSDGTTKLRLGEDEIEISSTNLPISITNGDASIDLAKDGSLTLAAKNITLDSEGKIDLKAKSGISVKATGTASFEGATTEVKGNKVAVTGSGMTEIKGAMVKVN